MLLLLTLLAVAIVLGCIFLISTPLSPIIPVVAIVLIKAFLPLIILTLSILSALPLVLASTLLPIMFGCGTCIAKTPKERPFVSHSREEKIGDYSFLMQTLKYLALLSLVTFTVGVLALLPPLAISVPVLVITVGAGVSMVSSLAAYGLFRKQGQKDRKAVSIINETLREQVLEPEAPAAPSPG